MSIEEVIAKEVRELSRDKVQEVLDFIAFLKHREDESLFLAAAENSLASLWDTPEEDNAWKDL